MHYSSMEDCVSSSAWVDSWVLQPEPRRNADAMVKIMALLIYIFLVPDMVTANNLAAAIVTLSLVP